MIRRVTIAIATLIVGCTSTSEEPKPPKPPEKAFDHFIARTRNHAWPNSYLLALTSKYADELMQSGGPEKQTAFVKKMRAMGMTRIDFIEHRDAGYEVQAAVLSNNKVIVIVFRDPGAKMLSSFIDNWLLTDANLMLAPDNRYGIGARVHTGLHRVIEEMRRDIGRHARSHGAGQGQSLWFTGHGNGGALATVGASAAARAGFAVAGVSTYGAPRPGNDAYAINYAKLSFTCQRWVYDNDLLATIPPDITLGYRHAGSLNNIRADGFIRVNDKENRAVGDIKKHNIEFYIDTIGRAQPDGLRAKMDAY